MPDQPSSTDPLAAFGPNEWLVDELYQQYLQDKNSVDKAWWEFFEDYQPGDRGTNGRTAAAGASTAAPAPKGDQRPARQQARPARREARRRAGAPRPPRAGRRGRPAQAAPAKAAPARRPRQARGQGTEPSTSVAEGPQGGDTPTPITREAPAKKSPGPLNEGEVKPLRGAAARVVTNMEASLQVPDRDQRARGPGQAAHRQPHRHQQPPGPRPRRQGLLHPPHRLRAGPGAGRRCRR